MQRSILQVALKSRQAGPASFCLGHSGVGRFATSVVAHLPQAIGSLLVLAACSRWRLTSVGAALVVTWAATCCSWAIAEDDLVGRNDREQLLKSLQERWKAVGNFAAAYSMTEIHTPVRELIIQALRASGQELGEGVALWEGTRQCDCSVRFLEGRLMFEQHVRGGDPSLVELSKPREIRSYHHGRTEYLYWDREASSPPCGTVGDRLPMPRDPLSVALGLRGFGRESWLLCDDLSQAKIAPMDSGAISLEVAVTPRVRHVWVLAPQWGFAPTSFMSRVDGKTAVECVNSDFRRVGTVMIPFSSKLQSIHLNEEGGAQVVLSQEITVSSFVLAPEGNTPESYYIKWPVGAQIADVRSPSPRAFLIRDRSKALTDDRMDAITRDKKHRMPAIETPASATQRRLVIAINIGVVVLVVLALISRRLRRA
jgi:hypothetical protein